MWQAMPLDANGTAVSCTSVVHTRSTAKGGTLKRQVQVLCAQRLHEPGKLLTATRCVTFRPRRQPHGALRCAKRHRWFCGERMQVDKLERIHCAANTAVCFAIVGNGGAGIAAMLANT